MVIIVARLFFNTYRMITISFATDSYLTFLTPIPDENHFPRVDSGVNLKPMEKRSPEISLLQQESTQWKTDVAFCRDEIKVLNRYLQDVREKNATPEMKQDLMDFQLKLSEKILFAQELINAVELNDEQLMAPSSQNIDSLKDNHSRLQTKVRNFCKEYTALKSVFVRFLAKADIMI